MSDLETNVNGWNEYQNLVLHELKSHSFDLREIRGEIKNIEKEIVGLKVKSGIWGLIAGAIPVTLALVLKLL